MSSAAARLQELAAARLRAMDELSTIPLTMSTLEIAGLTGKRHDHVLRDADKMLAELEAAGPKFGASYKDSTGRNLRCLNLPKRECLILVSEMRADEGMR